LTINQQQGQQAVSTRLSWVACVW